MSSTPMTRQPLPELSPAKRALLQALLQGRGATGAITPRAHGAQLPLSFPQERLWFLDRLQQGGASYVISQALRITGGVDEGALERALGEVVRRHASLRTTFRETDGVPAQVIAPFAGFALPVHDLSGLPEAEREAEARRLAARDAATGFVLTEGPLLRAALLRLGPGEHVLLLCVHHIVSDGWSMDVLARELWTLYRGFREGRDAHLPALPVQYADFAAWQREQSGGEREARELAYWKRQLDGAPEVLELGADRPRPAVPSLRAGSVPVGLRAAAVDRLRELARDADATLFMVVLAGFQALLSHYGGSDDVVVGTPSAGRTRHEVEGVVGLFMNTLVLRTGLSGDPSFREVVRRVRETVLGAYEHQDVPFERVVAELRPERSLSRAPLFQVLFQLDAPGELPPPPPGLRIEDMDPGPGAAKFDLALVVQAGARGLAGALDYSVDLFDHGTALRMAEHLERVLEQVSADPDRRLSRLELMGPAERGQVLEWNRTAAPYPADRCIHQLFEAQAARTPDAVAVKFGERSLTFRELDEQANRLAHHLVRLGVRPEVRVGICLERGVELLPALLGVMKAGGAYVPMDPAHPGERLGYVLDDSGVGVLLTQEALRGRLPARGGVRVVAVDGAWERIPAEGAAPPRTGVTSANLCYVIYTSGSTGRPKGVAMHHRGVANYVHWGVGAYGAGRGNGAPVFTSMAVDLTITNLLPLFAGRPVHLLPEADAVEALARTIRGGPGFGLVKITPIHLGLLNTMLTPAELASAAETLVIGADFLTAEPTVPWQEHAPGVRLMNEYGPTETVVGCSAYVLPPGRHRAGPVPVGGPIQNIRFHVLDVHQQPVPVGLPGELYVGGAGVARGYLGRPGLTAEKFVPDPHAEAGARMYRTGDRARWRADGSLLVLGRTDDQVKIRGYRVEPGEVEAALRRLPGVRECVVAVRDEGPGDRRLVAYVVGDADPGALRGDVRRLLPEHMVPAAFVVLDALPQTPTGKLDRRALPAPEYAGADAEFGEPRDYLEVRLIQLWEELLGVSGIGPTQGFFELGGNSLLALRLFARSNRAFACDLPVSTLFAGGTVRHMAQAIREQGAAAAAPPSAVVPLQPHGPLPPLFLVHAAGPTVNIYLNVVRHLGPDQPVFGLQDLDDDRARPVPRIAAEYVAAVRAVQPRGPYYLGGWSFGGYVVYEMAVQLHALGETVAFAGLMDTVAPALARAWPWNGDADLAVGMAEEVAADLRRPFSLAPEALAGLAPDEQLRRVVDELHHQGAAPAGFTAAALGEICRANRERGRSRDAYDPAPFPGTLTLFRADELSDRHRAFFARYRDEERRTLGWCRHAPVAVHPVPGSHSTLGAEPHVRGLVRHLRESLAAARLQAGPATEARP